MAEPGGERPRSLAGHGKVACPRCGALNYATDPVCLRCGAEQHAAGVPAPQAARTGIGRSAAQIADTHGQQQWRQPTSRLELAVYGAVLGAVVAIVVAFLVASGVLRGDQGTAAAPVPSAGHTISLVEVLYAAGGGALVGGTLSSFFLGDLLIGVIVGLVVGGIVAAGRLGASPAGFLGALLIGAAVGAALKATIGDQIPKSRFWDDGHSRDDGAGFDVDI